MKKRLQLLIETYILFILLFVLLKPVFMLYNHSVYQSASIGDYIKVIWHGIPMDMSVAGYLTVIPGLLLVVSSFGCYPVVRILQKIYFGAISLLIPLIYIVDMVLYGYWGFRLDSTPLFYFFSSPKDAVASVSIGFVLGGLLIYVITAVLLYLLFYRIVIKEKTSMKTSSRKYFVAGGMLLCTALLFLPIRGSITTSTMNLGRVYYSQSQQFNHAAINPCFSLLSSIVGGMKTQGMYRFMKPEEASRLFAQMTDTSDSSRTESLFNIRRPNIILVVLESFSAKIMATMGGVPGVAVNMDKFGQEGILFTNFYANSFRTDRGLASILAAYPAQPTTSIMKYPRKSESLPMFPKELKNTGYDLQYYYGGDADFTDMRSFLITAGFNKIVCDKDFPVSQRMSKWGVPDGFVYRRLLADLFTSQKQPFLKILQTSSSHEPYDVPYHHLKDIRLNAFSYADSCLGAFVNKLRTTTFWKNTVIILVPDHLGVYPRGIDNYSFERYHIPLIMIGGAVKKPMKIATYGSQIDITATLLSQLKLSHRAFKFSKDMMDPKAPHFGYSTFPNAFCMVTPEDSVFFNCETNKIIAEKGRVKGKNLPYGKAFLQKLYDDLSQR